MDLTYQSIKEQQETMIAELETIMEDASPSEAELCTDKINELKIKFDSDGPELNRLATIGWRELNSEEKLAGKSITVEYFEELVQIILMKHKIAVLYE